VVQDIRRDQVLIGAGWKVKRFWVYELREDMQRCVLDILACFSA
jgi:very-short-patch-repair endonuclease